MAAPRAIGYDTRMLPWIDYRGRFSPLKAAVLAALFVPALYVAVAYNLHWLGARPWTEAIHQIGAVDNSPHLPRPGHQPGAANAELAAAHRGAPHDRRRRLLLCPRPSRASTSSTRATIWPWSRPRSCCASISPSASPRSSALACWRRPRPTAWCAASAGAGRGCIISSIHRAFGHHPFLHAVQGRRVGADLDGGPLSLADGLARARADDAARAAGGAAVAGGRAWPRCDRAYRARARRSITTSPMHAPIERVLEADFTTDLGVRPAWIVLGASAAITLAAAARRLSGPARPACQHVVELLPREALERVLAGRGIADDDRLGPGRGIDGSHLDARPDADEFEDDLALARHAARIARPYSGANDARIPRPRTPPNRRAADIRLAGPAASRRAPDRGGAARPRQRPRLRAGQAHAAHQGGVPRGALRPRAAARDGQARLPGLDHRGLWLRRRELCLLWRRLRASSSASTAATARPCRCSRRWSCTRSTPSAPRSSARNTCPSSRPASLSAASA